MELVIVVFAVGKKATLSLYFYAYNIGHRWNKNIDNVNNNELLLLLGYGVIYMQYIPENRCAMCIACCMQPSFDFIRKKRNIDNTSILHAHIYLQNNNIVAYKYHIAIMVIISKNSFIDLTRYANQVQINPLRFICELEKSHLEIMVPLVTWQLEFDGHPMQHGTVYLMESCRAYQIMAIIKYKQGCEMKNGALQFMLESERILTLYESPC